MNVLLIALEFPPVNTTGNYRAARFAAHLRKFGINPIVLTLDEHVAARLFNRPIDTALLDSLPKDLTVLRYSVPSAPRNKGKLRDFLRIYFRITEGLGTKFWKAIQKDLPQIIERYKINAVYVTCPPFGMGKVGYNISGQYQLPLILDMRDSWSYWTTNPHNTWIHFYLRLLTERKWFRRADYVLGVTNELVNIFRQAHPSLPEKKFVTLFNGMGKFEAAPVAIRPPRDGERFSIGYLGSFYYSPRDREYMFRKWWQKPVHKMFEYRPTREDWLYRSPFFFLKTVAKVKELDPAVYNRISIEFIGEKPDWLDAMVRNFELQDKVIYHGFVDKEKQRQLLSKIDAYLTTSEKVIGKKHYCLPSKLFDYIRSGKPIFGFVTAGDQMDFLDQAGTAILFNPDDTLASAEKLVTVLQHDKLLMPNEQFLKGFDSTTLTGQLARLFHGLVPGKPPQIEKEIIL